MSAAKPPLVTVVVRLHDSARFAAAAIASALAQEYRPLEVLVIDDGSQDGSAEIAAAALTAYRGPHATRLLRIDPARGAGGALQAAVEAAAGAVLLLADGDDLSHPARAGHCAACFAADPSVLLVHCRQRHIDAAGRPIAAVDPPPAEAATALAAIAGGGGPPGAVAAYRRSLFAGFASLTPLQHSEDWLLAVRARLLGRTQFLDEILVERRTHAANVSGPAGRLAEAAEATAWARRHRARDFAALAALALDLASLAAAERVDAATLAKAERALAARRRQTRLLRAGLRVPVAALPRTLRALQAAGLPWRAALRGIALGRWPGVARRVLGRQALRRAALVDRARRRERA